MMENMSSDVPQLTQAKPTQLTLAGISYSRRGAHVLSSAVRYGFVHAQRA
jgi:hypothetical protein